MAPSSPTITTHDQPPSLSPLTPISPWPPLVPSPLPSRSSSPVPPSSRPDTSRHTQPEPRETRPPSELPNATDVYASIAILLTYALFAVYLAWAFLPSSWTADYLPDRQWALIVPCYLMILVLLTYWTYGALVIYRTPDFSSSTIITDPYAGIPPLLPKPRVSWDRQDQTSGKETEPYYWKYAGSDAIAEAVDLPIDLVGRVLYPPRRRRPSSNP